MPSFSARSTSPATRNKIVTDAMHFPSILYLIDQQRRCSAEVDVVPSHDGITVDTERLVDAIDEQTAIVNVSHVLFKSAFIHDVAAIAAKARRVGAITVIDGYQAVGTIPVDVRALGIDVYIGGCLKWLCGGPGAAFLWVDPDGCAAASSRRSPAGWPTSGRSPSSPSWTAATTPGGSCTARPASRPSTRRSPAWRSSTRSASRRSAPSRSGRPSGCSSWPTGKAIRCTTPRDPARRGGTVAIDVEHGYEISQSLKSLDILCDYRPGAGIRFSPHFYNRDDELDAADRGDPRDPIAPAPGGRSRPGIRGHVKICRPSSVLCDPSERSGRWAARASILLFNPARAPPRPIKAVSILQPFFSARRGIGFAPGHGWINQEYAQV